MPTSYTMAQSKYRSFKRQIKSPITLRRPCSTIFKNKRVTESRRQLAKTSSSASSSRLLTYLPTTLAWHLRFQPSWKTPFRTQRKLDSSFQHHQHHRVLTAWSRAVESQLHSDHVSSLVSLLLQRSIHSGQRKATDGYRKQQLSLSKKNRLHSTVEEFEEEKIQIDLSLAIFRVICDKLDSVKDESIAFREFEFSGNHRQHQALAGLYRSDDIPVRPARFSVSNFFSPREDHFSARLFEIEVLSNEHLRVLIWQTW